MRTFHSLLAVLLSAPILLIISSCQETFEPNKELNVLFAYDEEQERLDNLGNPSSIPDGHAAQSPGFRALGVFTIELAPDQFTLPGQGFTLFKSAETSAGGDMAIDFDELNTSANLTGVLPIEEIPEGTYPYLRVSVAYQNYDIRYNLLNTTLGDFNNETGTIASFLGYNTFINSVTPWEIPLEVNDDKLQGFWAFETRFAEPFSALNQVYSGQAPEGATTVVNPLAGIADIPPGSCIITGEFDTPLEVSGDMSGLTLRLNFSINDSFEWVDENGNGEWDFDLAAGTVEQVVDMGLRGLKADWFRQPLP